MDSIYRNLASPVAAVRANSIELLDNVLDTPTRRCLLPLIEERDPRVLAGQGDELFPLLHLDARAWLERLLLSHHEWTVVSTLETVGHLGDPRFTSSVRLLLTHRSALVRETTAVCLRALVAPQALAEALSPLSADPNSRVRDLAAFAVGSAAK
jgi:hypothetical protein